MKAKLEELTWKALNIGILILLGCMYGYLFMLFLTQTN